MFMPESWDLLKTSVEKLCPFPKVAKVIKTLIWVNFTKMTKYLENTVQVPLTIIDEFIKLYNFLSKKRAYIVARKVNLRKF
jgi:hypothetical protein